MHLEKKKHKNKAFGLKRRGRIQTDAGTVAGDAAGHPGEQELEAFLLEPNTKRKLCSLRPAVFLQHVAQTERISVSRLNQHLYSSNMAK